MTEIEDMKIRIINQCDDLESRVFDSIGFIHLLIHPEEAIVREEAQEATRYGVLPDWFALQ